MAWPLLLLLQIAIGALIGGMTNELAIRMLFRPYKPIYIGKWRVPFTPGLIPKRHEELALQMGKLVENFLITPQGVRNMLKKGEVEAEIQKWLQGQLDQWSSSEETLASFLGKWGIVLDPRLEVTLKQQLKLAIEKKISGASYSTLDEILPNEMKELLEQKIMDSAPFLLDKMSEYISSEEGAHFIRQMLGQLAGGLGMFGGLASMLLGDEKVIAKVGASLETAMKSEELRSKVGELLRREVKEIYKKQIGEVISWIGKEQVEKGLGVLLDKMIDLDRVTQKPMNQLILPFISPLREAMSKVVNHLFVWAENHLEQGLRKINLTKIAASQVENFPVHKLEEMIVSITGKELKMITVFGAILGGLIGAIQGMLVLLLQ